MSPFSRLLYHVSCLMSSVSCLLSPVLCPLSHVSFLTAPVSCLLSHVSCLTAPVSCLLSHASYVMSPFSCLLCHVSCLLYPVSQILFPVSYLLCDVSYLMCPACTTYMYEYQQNYKISLSVTFSLLKFRFVLFYIISNRPISGHYSYLDFHETFGSEMSRIRAILFSCHCQRTIFFTFAPPFLFAPPCLVRASGKVALKVTQVPSTVYTYVQVKKTH